MSTPSVYAEAQIRRQAIAEFIGAMSVNYLRHSGDALLEDKVFACIRFGVDPEVFYDTPVEATELKARIAYHRTMGTYGDETVSGNTPDCDCSGAPLHLKRCHCVSPESSGTLSNGVEVCMHCSYRIGHDA